MSSNSWGNAFYDNDLRNITTSFILKIFGLLFSFLLNYVLVKNIGILSYGRYIYFLSLINFCSIIGVLGLDDIGLKFLSKHFSLKNLNSYIFFLNKSLRFVFFLSTVISCIFFFISMLSLDVFEDKFYLILLSSILIPLKSITSIYNSAIRAIEKMSFYLKLNLIFRQLFLIASIIIIKNTCQWISIGALEIFLIIGIFQVIMIVFSHRYIKKNLPIKKLKSDKEGLIPFLKSISLYIFFIQSISLININLDNIFINYFIGTKSLTSYALASQLVVLVGFTLNAVNVFLAPTISKLFFKNKKNELQKKLKLISKINLFSGILSTGFILLFGKNILSIYGISVLESYSVVLILTIGSLFHVLCGSVTYLMIMTKIEKIAAVLTGLSAIMNMVFNFLLIPKYGIIGCAISTTVSVIFYNIISTFFIMRKLELDPTIFSLFNKK